MSIISESEPRMMLPKLNRRDKPPVYVVQGCQYGSEGKGLIAAHCAKLFDVTAAVRTGSINAGHTVYYKGKPYVNQILPTAWVNPDTELYIGAGAYIEPSILDKEIRMVNEATGEDIRNRLFIDHRAGCFTGDEGDKAKKANRHQAMGATGKGSSEAVINKMRNRGDLQTWKQTLFIHNPECSRLGLHGCLTDVAELIDEASSGVLLEGTQGTHLDFHLSPFPFTTHRQTIPATWMSEAGVAVDRNVIPINVFRTFPIRVAGNSGPMQNETSWPDLSRDMNSKLLGMGIAPMWHEDTIRDYELNLKHVIATEFPEVMEYFGVGDGSGRGVRADQFQYYTPTERTAFRECISSAPSKAFLLLSQEQQTTLKGWEKTTVTKKLRRISEFDWDLARAAVLVGGKGYTYLTFANYLLPELHLESADSVAAYPSIPNYFRAFMEKLETISGPLLGWTTGPDYKHIVDRMNPKHQHLFPERA